MKKMILAIAAAMTMTAAMAQGDNQQGRPDRKKMDKTEMVKMRTDRTVKQYGLNETQAKQLLDLNTKYADQMGPGMGGPRPGGKGMGRGNRGGDKQGDRPQLTDEQKAEMKAQHQKREESMKEYDAALQQILTADQYKAYKADAEKRMKEGRGRRPGGGPRQ